MCIQNEIDEQMKTN